MKDIKFLAIFVGLVFDIGGSLAAGLVMGIAIAMFQLLQGIPAKEVITAMDQKHLAASIPIELANLGVGGFFTFAGGFVTGWMAKSSQMKNALVMGILSMLFGTAFWNFNPLWFNLVCIPFVPAAATVGGYLAYVFFGQPSQPSA